MTMKTEQQQPAYSLAHQSASLPMICNLSKHLQLCTAQAPKSKIDKNEAVLRIPPVSSTWLGGQGKQTSAAACSGTASFQVRHLPSFSTALFHHCK